MEDTMTTDTENMTTTEDMTTTDKKHTMITAMQTTTTTIIDCYDFARTKVERKCHNKAMIEMIYLLLI